MVYFSLERRGEWKLSSRDLIDGLADKLQSKITLYENLLSLAGNIRKVVESDDFEGLEELNSKEESCG